MLNIIYFSNYSLNTERFVKSLQWEDGKLWRIPVLRNEGEPIPAPPVDEPYVLVSPSYGTISQGRVPAQVKKFLVPESHRENIKAVIATGNRNFGDDYCIAGNILSVKLQVPLIAKIELAGTPQDVLDVRANLQEIEKYLRTGKLKAA